MQVPPSDHLKVAGGFGLEWGKGWKWTKPAETFISVALLVCFLVLCNKSNEAIHYKFKDGLDLYYS